MKQLRNQDDYWKPCRPGTIFRATDSKFRRQRRKFAIQLAMGGVLAVTGITSLLFVAFQRKRGPALAENEPIKIPVNEIKLTCEDIVRLTPQYVKAVKLVAEDRNDDQKLLIADFDQHLQVCPNCPKKVLRAVSEA